MLPVGFALLLLGVGPSAPPALAVGAPRLRRGDELVYVGEIAETGERRDNRFKKKFLLEVRVFVLEAEADSADCAVMTAVTPQDDAKIAEAVLVVSGSDPGKNRAAPTVHLQLIRVDSRGRAASLVPPAGAPPFDFAKAVTGPLPPVPLDGAPATESGFFVPLPLEGAKVGDEWAIADTSRTPTVWSAKREAIWNGGRCVEVVATQKSTGWDRADGAADGWQRTDAISASPEDGYANSVRREIVRRSGREAAGSVTVRYELQQTNRYVGKRYDEFRGEVERISHFDADWNAVKRGAADGHARLLKMRRYAEDHPNASRFRPVLDSLLRRGDAGTGGVAPPVLSAIVAEPGVAPQLRIGAAAPDFVAADVDRPTGRFRLSADKSKPTAVIFFKPGSATSRETLVLAEALHRHFGDKIAVVPLAIGATVTEASKQRAELKLKVPVYDGSDIREAYRAATFPQFFLVEPDGTLNWTFDAGIGPETGYLLKRQLEALLK